MYLLNELAILFCPLSRANTFHEYARTLRPSFSRSLTPSFLEKQNISKTRLLLPLPPPQVRLRLRKAGGDWSWVSPPSPPSQHGRLAWAGVGYNRSLLLVRLW